MLKKISAMFLIIFLFYIPSLAENETDYTSSNVMLSFDVQQYRFIKNSDAVISLELNGKKYTQTAHIDRNTSNVELNFEVESYVPGTEFTITGEYGLCGIRYYSYYGAAGNPFTFNTYMTDTENGSVHNNKIYMTIDPLHYKDVDMFINYKNTVFTEPSILCDDEIAFVPIIEVAKSLGIDDAKYYPEYNCVRIAVSDTELVYYLDSKRVTINGNESEAKCDTKFINSAIFAPLKPFCDLFEAKLTFADEGDRYNINIDDSLVLKRYKDYIFGKAYVMNQKGISSNTNYLIWVSKSEFTVRVFTGSAGNWTYLTSFPCAIGASGSPTCEGTYKYYQYQDIWKYGSFYCAPIMRFNGGYAIHSTLIRYNGTMYDNRVGVRISHGCVRVRPENINWLVNTVPLQTTVHITA